MTEYEALLLSAIAAIRALATSELEGVEKRHDDLNTLLDEIMIQRDDLRKSDDQ